MFDATCPLVTKVHMEVSRYSRKGIETILIGHRRHPEVEGTMGQYDRSNGGDIYLVESVDDVRKLRGPQSTGTALCHPDHPVQGRYRNRHRQRSMKPSGDQRTLKEDICYATQNRQDAVKQLAEQCDLILVVGSKNSSNSNRLREIAGKQRIEGYLIDSADDIDPQLAGRTNAASGLLRGHPRLNSWCKTWSAIYSSAVPITPRRSDLPKTLSFPLPKTAALTALIRFAPNRNDYQTCVN